jgi:fructokinase
VHIGDWSTRSPARAGLDAVVDTMGAGDAVFATILSEIAVAGVDGVDWERALGRAMEVAAATVAHAGALLRLPSAG